MINKRLLTEEEMILISGGCTCTGTCDDDWKNDSSDISNTIKDNPSSSIGIGIGIIISGGRTCY